MDVKAPQVALSTVIGELTLNNDEEFGVDYFLRVQEQESWVFRATPAVPIPAACYSLRAVPLSVTLGSLTPAGLVNFANSCKPWAAGTNVYIAAGNYLSAIVHALDSTGRFQGDFAADGFHEQQQESDHRLRKGDSGAGEYDFITLPVAESSTAGLAQQSNIQFKKVALQLEVVPLINSEKEVSLDILQKIDSVAGTTTIDGNSIPNIATRYIRTTVSAPNGSTIVLGGLIMDDKARRSNWHSHSRPPSGGRRSFPEHQSKPRSRTELIILMRPEVTLTKLDLYRLRQKNEDRTHFGPELDQDDCPDCPPQ